jgi:acylglycerol lipase
MRRVLLILLILLIIAVSAGCTSRFQPHGGRTSEPVLLDSHAVMDDGYRLPISIWQPSTEPRAVVLALHGFNDYRNAFAGPGAYFAEQGIVTYAYDQRGFGETAYRGLWAGHRRMVADVRTVVALLRQRHPDLPVYLLGESMGGAVAIIAHDLPVEGLILSAPAVWSRDAMPWYQRAALWVAVRLVPGWRPTGQSLGRLASDNIEMLRALGRDPLVIKKTRIDTVAGMVDLMDAALAAAPRIERRTLVLYGANDQIIPSQPTCRLLHGLAAGGDWRFAYYPGGYHMLLRDLQAARVLDDVAHWMLGDGPLPSGQEASGGDWQALVCP